MYLKKKHFWRKCVKSKTGVNLKINRKWRKYVLKKIQIKKSITGVKCKKHDLLGATGLCAIFGREGLSLTGWALLRDTVSYIIALSSLVWFSWDSRIVMQEAASLLGLYAIYMLVLFMMWPRIFPQKEALQHEDQASLGMYGSIADAERDEKSQTPNDENEKVAMLENKPCFPTSIFFLVQQESYLDTAMDVVSKPFSLLFRFTVPDCSPDSDWRNWFSLP